MSDCDKLLGSLDEMNGNIDSLITELEDTVTTMTENQNNKNSTQSSMRVKSKLKDMRFSRTDVSKLFDKMREIEGDLGELGDLIMRYGDIEPTADNDNNNNNNNNENINNDNNSNETQNKNKSVFVIFKDDLSQVLCDFFVFLFLVFCFSDCLGYLFKHFLTLSLLLCCF